MGFFYDSVILFTKWCSSSSEHFAFNAHFLWEHSFCAPEGAERQWAVPGEDSWNDQTWQDPLWNFKQKMALTLRPPPQVYCSPSSAQTDVIINQYNLDMKPPSFIWCKGIHALQWPSFCLDYWNRTSSFSSDRITCFPLTRFSTIYACIFSYICAWIAKCVQR